MLNVNGNGDIKVFREPEEFEETPLHIAFTCYFSYLVLNLFGYLRDFMRNTGLEKNRSAIEKNREVGIFPGPIYLSLELPFSRDTFHYTKVTKVSILETFIAEFVMVGINPSQVCQVQLLMSLTDTLKITTGLLS